MKLRSAEARPPNRAAGRRADEGVALGDGAGELPATTTAPLVVRARAWLAANTWTPAWQATALPRPIVAYLSAIAAVAAASGLTSLLEHALPRYAFHAMLGIMALLGVSLLWGPAPAALGALLNAIVLNFVVTLPSLAAPPARVPVVAAHLLSALLTLCFGLAVAVFAGLSEARRRQLVDTHAARERLHLSEQQAHAEALAERDRLQQIVEMLPEAFILYDRAGARVRRNRAATVLLGADLLGQPVAQDYDAARRLDGTAYTRDEFPVLRSIQTGEVVVGEQMFLRNLATGDETPILLSSAPLLDLDGAITGAMAVFQDISAIVALERQRDHMLSMVTHDLRNPVTTILGMSQLLQQQVGCVDEAARDRFMRSLKHIEGAAERMTAQIGDLLDHARTHAARPLQLALEAIDIVGLLRGVLAEHQHATDRHRLELRCTDEPIVATVDPRRVERAVTNLLVNAIKYSPLGGPVVVSVARAVELDGPWLRIEVADHGMGIPSADQPHLFEPYYRASNVTATIPGTGIGLAGVRHIAQSHGGTVTLESTEGVRTTVTLRLPLHHEAETHTGAAS